MRYTQDPGSAPRERRNPSGAASGAATTTAHTRQEHRFLFVLLLLFVCLAAGIMTVGYRSYRSYAAQYRAQVESQLSAIAELKVAELVQWRNERMGDASIIFENGAFSSLVARFLADPRDADAQRQIQVWMAQYRTHLQYDQVRLLDPQGATRLSAPAKLPPASAVVRERIAPVVQLGQVAMTDVYQDGTGVFEYRVLRPDGTLRHVAAYGELGRDTAGDPVSIFGTVLDVTDLRQKERELQERNDELVRFTYTVSHDLKNPLVTITTFLGFLEQDTRHQDAARMEKDLAYIRGAADKMARLLDELLELSRVGRKMNPFVEMPLQAIVQDAQALVAGQITARGVQVVVTSEPVLLYGDRRRLVEVFQNLLDNAVKFMGDQPAPCVEIGARPQGADTVVFVRDNGIGIDPRHQHKLFGLFEKLDPGAEGTGMGLALARRIVEVHGGRMWVELEGAGMGAAFSFTMAKTRRVVSEGQTP